MNNKELDENKNEPVPIITDIDISEWIKCEIIFNSKEGYWENTENPTNIVCADVKIKIE